MRITVDITMQNWGDYDEIPGNTVLNQVGVYSSQQVELQTRNDIEIEIEGIQVEFDDERRWVRGLRRAEPGYPQPL